MIRFLASATSAAVLLSTATVSLAATPARALPQFQCMSLAHLWDGQGPMPPPVAEFASPSPDAPQVGIAMSTIVVDRPMSSQSGRVRVIRPDGREAWIDSSQIAPWHVVSNPNARCAVVQMMDGRIGTISQ